MTDPRPGPTDAEIAEGVRLLNAELKRNAPAIAAILNDEDPVAEGRAEDDFCQRGTQGCSVDHRSDSDCQPW